MDASSVSKRVESAVLYMLVVTSGIYFFSPPVADNDLWGHIAFGREILQSRALPILNRYSYTEPMHPWINHEFAAECLFALLYDRLGAPALLALKVAAGLITLGIVAWTVRLRTRAVLAGSLALVATASMMSFGYMVRPQIFTFLALALLWNRLQACAAGGENQRLWLLPLLFVLWINSHGGVMAGMAVLLAFTALTIAAREPVPRGALVATAVASATALLCNPYGIFLPLFLVEDLHRVRPISEWAPIALSDVSNLHFKLAVAMLVVGMFIGSRRLWEIAILACTGLATFRHQRHLPLFAILAAPALAEAIEHCGMRLATRMTSLQLSAAGVGTIAVAGTILASYQLATVIDIYRSLRGQIFVAPNEFPVSAVRFIRDRGLRGNLALPFDWGEYAIWHLYPRSRVSVDGRYSTAYSDELLASGFAFREGGSGWDRFLPDADLTLVYRDDPVASLLLERPEWQCVYADTTAMVFVRGVGSATCAPSSTDASRTISLFP